MSDRFPGGVISKTPPEVVAPVDGEGGSASGVWTLDEVLGYEKAGAWPKKVLPRELYAWGDNSPSGDLGDGTVVDKSSPVQVGALTDWAEVDTGNSSGAVKTNGTLWAWGYGGSGSLGTGTSVSRSSPVQVGALTNWYKVSVGGGFCLATKTDGTLWAWGINSVGQLGDGTIASRSSPVQVGALTNWAQVSAGNNHSVSVKTDGTLWAWGDNSPDGELGDNTTADKSSPVQIGALTTWYQAAAGNSFTAAVKTNGTIWAWGNAVDGKLGNNDQFNNKSSPIQIGALTTWSSVSTSSLHCAALKTDGTLWAWGVNQNGRLGDGTVANKSSPVQIGALTTWSSVSAGAQHSAALKTDGTLWAWGNGASGRVGDGTVISRSSPVQIGALTTWYQVSAGLTGFNLALTRG